MKESYFELEIIPSGHFEVVETLLGDIFDHAIEETETSLILRTEEDPSFLIPALQEMLQTIQDHGGDLITFTSTLCEKPNQDWIAEYQRSIEPVECGEFYIRASWHEPQTDKIELLIDPALAFGSGHHPSTRNILALSASLVKPDMRILDVGCGSGILGIGAAKKGGTVDICDTDPFAVESAQSNFAINGVSCAKAWEGSVGQAQGSYDIVFANIVADVILMLAKQLKEKTAQGGYLLLSGIVENRENDICQKFSDMTMLSCVRDEGWLTYVYQKTH